MCGLIGSIGCAKNRSLDVSVLAHRGPDGSGVWSSPEGEYPIALAHTRLAILDLTEDGEQPFFADNRRYVFIFNGEIYNFIELRKNLEKVGHQFLLRQIQKSFCVDLLKRALHFNCAATGCGPFVYGIVKRKLRYSGAIVSARSRFFIQN